MTAITQKIRRFTGGISDQPDEQKIPGQVRDAVNCVPDVVQGLIKRPGLNLVSELETTKGGKWFFIDKSNNFNSFDRYVGQIDNLKGKVKIWDLDSGKMMDICYTDNIDPLDLDPSTTGITYNIPEYNTAYTCEGAGKNPSEDYFVRNSPEIDDLQVLTINDYTFVTNRKVPVEMSQNTDEKRPPEATVELRSIAGLTEYKVEFFEPESEKSIATELTVSGTGFESEPKPDGSCANTYTGEFTRDGVRFRITTSSTLVPFQEGEGTVDKCVYSTKIDLLDGGTNAKVGDEWEVESGNGVRYRVVVQAVTKEAENKLIGEASATTERENPKADDIFDELVTQIEALGFEAKRIGNSLYITRDEAFSVTTPNGILLRVLSSTKIGDNNFIIQANDVSELPLQSKHNLPFQVRNSFSDADDYYVKFNADNNQDGTGTYVEIAKPGIPNAFVSDSMPHGILRLSRTRKDGDGDTIVTFLVASFRWAPRQAGDDLTNPRPSFAPDDGATFGRAINNLAFFRNRFVTLTDENVVCSVAGDFFNFWAKTAQTVSPSDPIDLQVSNNFPAVLYGSIATTSGLVLFSENAQFMLSTENDVLEPRTARTTVLSTYNYNRDSNPVNLGTTVGFVSGIGRYTRFYEMANISRDQEPEVVEQTKVVERLVPGGYYEIGISKDNQLVAMAKRESDEVWVFRYFNTGERRAQSAWVRWKLTGDIVSHSLINDSYFTVLVKEGKVFLLRGDVRALQSTIMLSENGEDYRTFLDYATPVEAKQIERTSRKYSFINANTIDFPIFSDLGDKIFAVLYEGEDDQGYILKCSIEGNYIKVPGKISDPQKFFLGYVFDMHIDLPQFYVKKEANGQTDSWDTANVIVQRVKINFGRIGYYETTLKRLGRDDYTQIYEAKPMDLYDANELGYQPDYEQTTPIYQRNTTFRMIISSEHPAPAVLYSATWEGQYQENYVKRL